MTQALEDFDFVELVYMLARGGKTGAMHLNRDGQAFALWLRAGRVRQMSGPEVEGEAALIDVLEDPRGRFLFEEAESAPAPDRDVSWEAFALSALKLIPPPPLKFSGAALIKEPQVFDDLELSMLEREVIRGVQEGHPLSELARTHEASALLGRLGRLRLITERKTRVARLTVQMTQQISGVVLVDELIFRRWRDAAGSHIDRVQIRSERSGQVHPAALRAVAGLGSVLQVPPDVMMRCGLRVGDAVQVRPA